MNQVKLTQAQKEEKIAIRKIRGLTIRYLWNHDFDVLAVGFGRILFKTANDKNANELERIWLERGAVSREVRNGFHFIAAVPH